MKPTARTRIYVIAFVTVVLALVAAVIFGVTDLAAAQSIVLWVGSIFGLPLGVAVAHRPTKPTP
jgi:uncharacterized membrane protein YfcA